MNDTAFLLKLSVSILSNGNPKKQNFKIHCIFFFLCMKTGLQELVTRV